MLKIVVWGSLFFMCDNFISNFTESVSHGDDGFGHLKLVLCQWSPVQGGDRQIIKRAPKVLRGRFSGLLKSPPKVPKKISKRTPRADGTTQGVLFHIFLEKNGRGLRPRPTREGGGFAAALPHGFISFRKIHPRPAIVGGQIVYPIVGVVKNEPTEHAIEGSPGPNQKSPKTVSSKPPRAQTP